MGMEKTLSIIKPDGVRRNLVGKILSRFEENNLQIVCTKMIPMAKSEAEGFYSVHKGKPFFDELTSGKGPKFSILALGYAGWGPGQLESEIMHNSWMSLSVDTSFLFDDEVSYKWNQAFKILGVDPSNLSTKSGKA